MLIGDRVIMNRLDRKEIDEEGYEWKKAEKRYERVSMIFADNDCK